MKKLLPLLFSVSIVHAAPDAPKRTCADFGGMAAVLETGDAMQAQTCLDHFKFSPGAEEIQKEASEVSHLCARFIPLDPEGWADEDCFNIYNANPKAMLKAWKDLSVRQRLTLEKSLKHMQKVAKHGNGNEL